jgi:hypothetical protein
MRAPRFTLIACAAWAALAASVVGAGAQAVFSPTEHIAFDRPEAWALKYFTSVTLFTGLEPPVSRAPGTVLIGLELGWVPSLDEAQRRVGFDGTKPEDLNKAPIFLQPRVTIGLPGRYSLIVAFTPPVHAFGLEPRLLALAIERSVASVDGWRVGLRGGGQLGTVSGAYTCPEGVLAFAPGSAGNLYGCQALSSDTATLRFLGGEASFAYKPGAARFSPHATVGVNYLDLGFQVNALTFGFIDHTHLLTHGTTVAMSGGVTVALGARLAASADLFYSPLSVERPAGPAGGDGLLNLRALFTYRVH